MASPKVIEVAISGMSGRFPESDNIEEFAENLFGGVDMVTADDRRWPIGYQGLPTRNGKLKDITRFDASFFNVHSKHAHNMDPQMRMLLESTYEAIVDAGVNPETLRGSNTGVFTNEPPVDSLDILNWNNENPYAVIGCHSVMFPNRISYIFDFKGPSFTVNTACSSSSVALTQAVKAIQNGECENAIVAGCNLCLKPGTSVNFQHLNMLSPDGKCAAFDAKANGYVRSEAIVVLFLQRRSICRRVYAIVRGAKVNVDGAKSEGINYPSGASQGRLVMENIREAGVKPDEVVYFEAHGTGTKVGDPEELNGIAEVFCKDRKTPLLVGSVKSNIGHTEPVSGLCAIVKVILAMERGIIPGNLHFKVPNPDIPALVDGRLKVVDRNTKWSGGIVSINSFGFGGANANIILESPKQGIQEITPPVQVQEYLSKSMQEEKKVNGKIRKDSTHAETIQESAQSTKTTQKKLKRQKRKSIKEPLNNLLGSLKSELKDEKLTNGNIINNNDTSVTAKEILEIFKLPNDLASCTRSSESSNSSENSKTVNSVDHLTSTKDLRLVVASGRTEEAVKDMLRLAEDNSQNEGLLAMIDEIHAININGHPWRGFKVLGANFEEIMDISSPRPIWLIFSGMGSQHAVHHDLVEAMVSIITAQVELVDWLRNVGVVPDGYIGHSVGEIGCAYADNALTSHQAIMTAHWRGRCLLEASVPSGAMAAVGLPWKLCEERCPEGVVVACHNAKDNTTVSGPKESIQKFVDELSSEGTFAKLVDSSGISFHSPSMRRAVPKLLEKLESVIPSPVERTEKWVTTSAADERGKLCDADYFVNNLVSPVLFEEALQKIPSNAIVIEVAPHSILQAILKRALPSAVHIPLLLKNQDSETQLLKSLGRIYNAGAQPSIESLYPEFCYPVPQGTPSISSKVRWQRSERWTVADFKDVMRSEVQFEFDLNGEDEFLCCHNIDGRLMFPASGYLVIVWKAIAILNNRRQEDTPVIMEDVEYRQSTLMEPDIPVRLRVHVLETGQFTILEKKVIVATGIVRIDDTLSIQPSEESFEDLPSAINSIDFYKEAAIRGYNYEGIFRGVISCSQELDRGLLEWGGNWIAFIDTMSQLLICGQHTEGLHLPAKVSNLKIDPTAHLTAVTYDRVPITIDKDSNTMVCGGVEFHGLATNKASRKPTLAPKLERYEFVPYFGSVDKPHTKHDALTISLQIILENAGAPHVRVCEVAPGHETLTPDVLQVLNAEPLIAEISKEITKVVPKLGYHVILSSNILSATSRISLTDLLPAVEKNGMILLEEEIGSYEIYSKDIDSKIILISHHYSKDREYLTFRKRPEIPSKRTTISIDSSYSWLDLLQTSLKAAETEDLRIYLLDTSTNGVLGLGTCLRAEAGVKAVRVFLIEDEGSIEDEQMQKDLAVNVKSGAAWGCYRHLEIKEFDSESSNIIGRPSVPRRQMNIHRDKCYVIVGGLGGVGLELARWLVNRGARKLMINSRRGIRTGYQQYCLNRLKSQGMIVEVSTIDLTKVVGARTLLHEANAMAPVGGIFNLAAVLQDKLFESMKLDDFKATAASKLLITQSLDVASRPYPLDHFIIFSTVSGGRGNHGQTNYGMANAAGEAVVRARRKEGLCGHAVQWGAIGQVGLFVDTFGSEKVTVSGTLPQVIGSCMETLEALCSLDCAVTASIVMAERGGVEENAQDLLHAVGGVFGLRDVSNVNGTVCLQDLGLDSLMAAELKQLLERHGVSMSLAQIRQLNFDALRSF